jgi:hypothetical protein
VPNAAPSVSAADAIARRGAAVRALDAARRTATRSSAVVGKAEAALQAARDALSVASEERALALAESAEVGTPSAAATMRAARAAVTDAEDELGAAQSALTRIQPNLPDLEDDLRAADNFVIVAADMVLRSHAERILAEAEELQARLAATRCILHFMRSPETGVSDPSTGRQTPVFPEEDWTQARRTLGPERADRRHYANSQRR